MNLLYPAFLAILSALFFAISNVTTKKGLASSNPISAFFVDTVTCTLIFAALLPFIIPLGPISYIGIVWFAISGVMGTTLGRATQFYAINRMGAASASPVANIYPFFSSLTAVIFLGEPLTVMIAAGTALTVIGVFMISLKGEAGVWTSKYIVVPISSALFFGVGVALRKFGLILLPNPIFGVAVNVFAAFASLLVYLVLFEKRKDLKFHKNTRFFVASGVAESLALITLFGSLNYGPVTVIGPISSITPLFVLILAFSFLRDVEAIRLQVVVGSAFVVAGLIFVAI